MKTISAKQAATTKQTEDQCSRFLDYVAAQPNISLMFHNSYMVLTIDSDYAYLVEPQANVRVAGDFQRNSNNQSSTFVNGAILIECKTLCHVVASSSEVETSGILHSEPVAITLIYILTQMGHPQPDTPLKTDNATANMFFHDNIAQKRLKSWVMRFYWLQKKTEIAF